MQTIRLAITLFTRDLRLHHNPALAAALDRAGAVLPVFVLDDGPGWPAGPARKPADREWRNGHSLLRDVPHPPPFLTVLTGGAGSTLTGGPGSTTGDPSTVRRCK
jgi:DNA photolyase